MTGPICENCGAAAFVTLAPPRHDSIDSYDKVDDPFQLCWSCVPDDLRTRAVPIAGREADAELMLHILTGHRHDAHNSELAHTAH